MNIEFNVFDQASIDMAIAKIDWIKARLDRLETFHEELAQLGVKVAQEAFASIPAHKAGDYSDIVVTYNLTENGFEIFAQGERVAYAEFGAGVYYNGHEPYGDSEIKRPADIDPIGQHPENGRISGAGWWRDHYYGGEGYSKGVYDAWAYYIDKEAPWKGVIATHGTKAVQGLYKADRAIHERAVEIFEKVFRDD